MFAELVSCFPKNFGNMALVIPTGLDRVKRFAGIVTARRKELGLNQEDLRSRGGPSTTTMTKVENASGIPSDLTLRKLDAGLQWEPGSAAITLDGGDPLPLMSPAKSIRDATNDELFAELRRRIPDDNGEHGRFAWGEPGAWGDPGTEWSENGQER